MIGQELIGEIIIGSCDAYETVVPDTSVFFSLGGYDLNGHVVLPISISGMTRNISSMGISTRAKCRLSETGMDHLKYHFQLIFSDKIEADAFRRVVNGLSEDAAWCGGRSDWYQVAKYVSVSPAEIIDDLIHYLCEVTLEFENPMLIKMAETSFLLTKASLPIHTSGFENDGTADAPMDFVFDARYADGQHLKALTVTLFDGPSIVSEALISNQLLNTEHLEFSEGDTILSTYSDNFIDPAKLPLDIYDSSGITIHDGYIQIAAGGRLTYKFFGPNPTLDNILLQADFLVTAGLPYVRVSSNNIVSPWGEADLNNIGTKPIMVGGTYTGVTDTKYEVKLGQGTPGQPDTYSYRSYVDEAWSGWSTSEPIMSGGFKLGLDSGSPVDIVFSYGSKRTGATIAASIQAAIQALAGDYSAMTCSFGGGNYTITHASKQPHVTPATRNSLDSVLKLGVANGGTETGKTSVSSGGVTTLVTQPNDLVNSITMLFHGGFMLKVGTGTATLVSFSYDALTSGATIAAEIQAAIQALGGDFAAITCAFSTNYTLTHASKALVVTDAIQNNLAAILKLGVANGGTEAGFTSVSNGGAITLAVQSNELADIFHIYSHEITNWKTAIATHDMQDGYHDYYLDESDKRGDIYVSFYCPSGATLDINFLRFVATRTIVPETEFVIPAGKTYSVVISDATNSSHEVDTDISFCPRSWP